ncbi:hypothetical protein VCHA53O466_50260 [Vibrio chagasii]|nr:hypothetical protein VCHA53O466_50260 [Vibrio chagasii]
MQGNGLILHKSNSDLEGFSRQLAKILNNKVSRSKELHAKALGFNSFNALLSANEHDDVTIPIGEYISNLLTAYQDLNKRQLDAAIIAKIEAQLAQPLDCIFKRATVADFIRFALIESSQDAPLISKSDINACLPESGYGKQWQNLITFLETGEVDKELVDYIGEAIKKIRKSSSANIPNYSSSCGTNLRRVHLLKEYRDAVIKFKRVDVHHVYFLPLVYMGESDSEYYDQCVLEQSSATNDVRLRLSKPTEEWGVVRWGSNFESVQSLRTKLVEDYIECDGQNLSFTTNLPIYNVFPTQELYSRDAPMLLDGTLGFYDFNYRFGLKEGGELQDVAVESAKLGIDFIEYELSEDIYTPSSGIFVKPIVKKGTPLTSDEIGEIRKAHIDIYELDENDELILGEITKIDFDGTGLFEVVIGSAIRTLFNEHPDAYVSFYDSERKGQFFAFDTEKFIAPLGKSPLHIERELGVFIKHISDSYEICHDSVICNVAKSAGCKPVIMHTYTNNMALVEEDAVSSDHMLNEDMVVSEDYVIETGLDSTVHFVDSMKSFVKSLPFDLCRNVYATSCDHGSIDDPIVFIGFDSSGEQILNATLYVTGANHRPSYWALQAELLTEIRKAVSGILYHHYDEIGYPFVNDTFMYSTDFNELELGKAHFNYLEAPNYPEYACLKLHKLLVRLPKGVDASVADRLLRENLSFLDAHESGASNVTDALIIGGLTTPPDFLIGSSDYDWYEALTTSEAKVVNLPIQELKVPSTDIYVYQFTNTAFLSNSDCSIDDAIEAVRGGEILVDSYEKLLVNEFSFMPQFDVLIGGSLPDDVGVITPNVKAKRLAKLKLGALIDHYLTSVQNKEAKMYKKTNKELIESIIEILSGRKVSGDNSQLDDVLHLVAQVDLECYLDMRHKLNDIFNVGDISEFVDDVSEDTERGDFTDTFDIIFKELFSHPLDGGATMAHEIRLKWRDALITELDAMVQR